MFKGWAAPGRTFWLDQGPDPMDIWLIAVVEVVMLSPREVAEVIAEGLDVLARGA